MLQTKKHTSNFVMPLRFSPSNRTTTNTKTTRPVFVERENPDTPPTITEHVRELAKLIRNTNPITERTSEFDRGCERFDILADAFMLRHYSSIQRLHLRPLWVIIATAKCKNRRKWYSKQVNITPKPAKLINDLVARFTIPSLEGYTHTYFIVKAILNQDSEAYANPTKTPRDNHPAVKMHFLTACGNIQPKDKPAFRHDSLFLFDTLSEDYNS